VHSYGLMLALLNNCYLLSAMSESIERVFAENLNTVLFRGGPTCCVRQGRAKKALNFTLLWAALRTGVGSYVLPLISA